MKYLVYMFRDLNSIQEINIVEADNFKVKEGEAE